MKRIMLPVILLIIVTTFLLPDNSSAHNEIQEIDEQLQQLKQEKAAAEKRAKDAMSRMNMIDLRKEEAAKDIASLFEQMDEAAVQMASLQSKIEGTEIELIDTERQLNEAVDRITKRDKLIKSRLRLIYMNGSVSYLEVLLNSTSFSDFLNRYEGMRMLIGQDKEILASNKRDLSLIDEKKIEMESMLAGLTVEYSELERLRRNLLVKEKQKAVMIASLQKEEEQLEGISKEQEQILISSARKEAELLRKKSSLANNSKTNTKAPSGKYVYPLPQKYRISSNFGSRVDPITGKKGAYHSGLDIAAPGGTNVLAAEQGTVIVAQWYGGYGNTVIIDHGGGTWTLYAHMRSLNVNKGDEVKKGNKVGEVGTTGRSTGNHLHFEVRVNEKAVNPKSYIGL